MLAHLSAIKALVSPLMPVYIGDATGATVLPYSLLWSSSGLPGVEQAVDAIRTDIDTTVGVTTVATTVEGALIAQKRVRGVLAPGGAPKALTVAGRTAWLLLFDSQPVTIDRDVTPHVAVAVDVYRLISTPT